MNKLYKIFISILICFFSISLEAQPVTSASNENGKSINTVDANNLKQGFWKISGKMRKKSGFTADQIIEQGNYINNRKQGNWTKFYPKGKVKSVIEYKNGKPYGAYKTFYKNGQIQEEGVWKNNRNMNSFKRYYENGQVSQNFKFNTSGKRDGKQLYYHENGKVMIEADVASGKEKFVKEYYEDGSVKSEKTFVAGKVDATKTKSFKQKTPTKGRNSEELTNGRIEIVKANKNEKVNSGVYTGDGHYKMYNSNKQISKDGFFKKYRLMNGKCYKYNRNGILIRIKIIKKGRYIGDAPLTKD